MVEARIVEPSFESQQARGRGLHPAIIWETEMGGRLAEIWLRGEAVEGKEDRPDGVVWIRGTVPRSF